MLQFFLWNGCLARHKFKDLACFIEIIILNLVIFKLLYDHIEPSYSYKIIIILLNLVIIIIIIIIIIINLHDLHNICSLVQTAGINKFLRKKKCIKIAKELEIFFSLTFNGCMLK